jgi:antitoxin (DNA-binding transcriptional repressor) of toxin-antitoxin stability system
MRTSQNTVDVITSDYYHDYGHMPMDHVMDGIQISKSEFKSRALEFFRQVEASGERVVVTDHGKPALEVRPYRNLERDPLDILRGSVIRFDEPTAPVDAEWEAAQ